MDGPIERLSPGDHPVVIGASHLSPRVFRKCLEGRRIFAPKLPGAHRSTLPEFCRDTAAIGPGHARFAQSVALVQRSNFLALHAVKAGCIADSDLTTAIGKEHIITIEEVEEIKA